MTSGDRLGADGRRRIHGKKMMAASGGRSPPKLLSTHPLSAERIQDIERRLPRAQPFYEAADKPERQFGPPQVPPT